MWLDIELWSLVCVVGLTDWLDRGQSKWLMWKFNIVLKWASCVDFGGSNG